MISKNTIQKINDAIDIVDVISDFVSLKKKGSSWSACCPFHNEKSPSFSVSAPKQIYNCFGCHKAGNAISFIMEIEKCSYPDALRYLAKKYHIEIEEEQTTNLQAAEQSLRESLLVALNFAKDYYKNILVNDSEGKSLGLSYFKERGFTAQTLEKFELGYSKDEWQGLENAAIIKSFSKDILEKSGLIIKKEDSKTYDRFRGRVMFPIHNLSGKVVGFGARTLKKDEKPKYLNSPETEVYVKNEILYGIYQAKNAIRNFDECLLTEGYTDVLSLHQNGIENVVASSGTALTDNQIRLIKRFTENITVLYDGDSAGIKAALRGIDLLLAQGLNVKIVIFPNSEDPDSYVRKVGGEVFKKYISENSKDFITFKTEYYLKEAGNDSVKIADLIRNIVTSICKIPDEIKRSVFLKQISLSMGISIEILIAESNKILGTNSPKLQATKEIKPIAKVIENAVIDSQISLQEKESIRLLLCYGECLIDSKTKLWQYFFNEIEDIVFKNSFYENILSLYRAAIKKKVVADMQYFLLNGSIEVQKIVNVLSFETHKVSDNWEKVHKIVIPKETDVLPTAIYQNILRLKLNVLDGMIKENLLLLDNSENDIIVLQKHIHFTENKKVIAKELGSVVVGWS